MGDIQVNGKNLFDEPIFKFKIRGDSQQAWNELCSTGPYTLVGCDLGEGEEKEEDEMEVLEIYKEREKKLIKEKTEESIKAILEKDEFTKLTEKYTEEVRKLYKKEYEEDFKYPFESFVKQKKTKEAIEKIKEEEEFELHNLEEMLEEVEARLDMTEDYDKQVEILKVYKILDEEGRINA